MVSAHFSFETRAFLDTNEVLAQNVNSIHGHSLAEWLSRDLQAAGLLTSEVWAEDHGWDFSITFNGATYLCACSLATDGDPPFEGHVAIAKHRSLFERLTGRNAFTADDAVAGRILDILRRSPDVAKLTVDKA